MPHECTAVEPAISQPVESNAHASPLSELAPKSTEIRRAWVAALKKQQRQARENDGQRARMLPRNQPNPWTSMTHSLGTSVAVTMHSRAPGPSRMSAGRHMSSPGTTAARRYVAFISYSHVDRDIARWLHRSIEGYRLPARLQRRLLPRAGQ